MISYHNEKDCRYILKHKRVITEWLKSVAKLEGGFEIDALNYIFCPSDKHRQMNIEFVGHDYFTDIITFDYSDHSEGFVAGDIYIDAPTVKDNAKIYGTTFSREMRRVVVHGLLHLCGQGDKSPEDEAQMHQKEDKYLDLLDKMLTKEGKR